MLFRRELISKILARRKTQTRRLDRGRPCPYRAGRTYAIQPGRGQRAIGHIYVQAVRRQRLGRITPADARREGFEDVTAFFMYWLRLHRIVNMDSEVFVIDFMLVR